MPTCSNWKFEINEPIELLSIKIDIFEKNMKSAKLLGL